MRNINIKNKIINHLTLNGNKQTSEKKFNQNLKELNKTSTKLIKELIKLALIKVIPIFKLHIIKKKKKKKKIIKEIPTFISNTNRRTSLAIKFIILSFKEKKRKNNNLLSYEILNILQNNSETINKKNTLQKQVIKHKRYFSFYRW
jgi:ribosomal protein S7